MEKMIQALFNNEVEAFTGLQGLQQLDQTKDISLGETYVLTKDDDGKTAIRSAKDKAEGTGVVSGGLVGGLLGLLAGPLGFIVGVAGGMIAGSASDTLRAEDVSDYLDKVSANIPTGKSVLIAHVWEDWETPVDTVLLPISIDLKRFDVHEELFLPAQSELSKTNEAIKAAETKYLEAQGAEKADWNATLANLRTKREQLQRQLDVNTDQQEKQYQAWIDNTQPPTTEPSADTRERLQNRLEEQQKRLAQIKRNR
ncbi:putative membrane protein [Pedobacter sp. CAN_A7]|uniref:DUF1269 domain-containing protein n=1 Tax=Pedobacter sp. CAN_A7 TaxID=2787722 RepID=UPI0018CAF92E